MNNATLLPLVPYPRDVLRRAGQFTMRPSTRVLISCAGMPACIRHKLATLGLGSPAAALDERWTVIVGTPATAGLKPPRHAEGYALHGDRGGVIVRGADANGLFWGLVTLEQLLNGGRTVPCVTIRDWPAFAFRYHHDDVSRKQVSTVVDFKRIIRLLSSYKIKYYTPYLEDMLFLKSFPDIGKGRGRLMPDEVRAIREEAHLHNVTVFPTFSLIGHQENLLANPRYRKFAREVFQSPSSFDPAKPALPPFLRKVIRDVCELFPDAPFIHAGFDETQGVPEQELIAHANWCADEIGRHGKRMLMWVDMFKNHFGLEALHKLSSNITPVEWEYRDPAPVVPRYRSAGVQPAGLAGYNNWGCYLPDFRIGKANIDQWISAAKRMRSIGFGASMWGDDGYENSRDLCWNLFAYSGEAAWTGDPGHGHDFERRFQTTFYGRPIEPLRRLIEDLAIRRKISARETWNLFRDLMSSLVRRVTVKPDLAERAKADLELHECMLAAVASARSLVRREPDHLDHFTVALERQKLVCERVLLAQRIARGLAGALLKRAIAGHCRDLRRVRDLYRRVWLRQNKRPNIEVSLAVFDNVERSLRELVAVRPTARRGSVSLDLGREYDAYEPAVAGIPLAPARFGGVPFGFAGLDKTHVRLADQRVVTLSFEPTRVSDVHLLCAGFHMPRDAKALHPILEVRLLNQGRCVFAETLLTIRHLCDWFAPRGEHMWAGGGLRYADPARVSFAFPPGVYHGVMHLRGFHVRGRQADTIEFRALSLASEPRAGVALFAATVETL